MNKFWIITKEVFKKNIKSFGFLAMVLIPLVIVGFLAGLGYYFSQEAANAEAVPVAILTEDESLQTIFTENDWNIDVNEEITTEEEAETALIDEDIEGYIVAESDGSSVEASIVHTNGLSQVIPQISEALTTHQAMLRAAELGLSSEEVMSLYAPVALDEQVVSISEGSLLEEDQMDRMIQVWSAYAVSIAIMAFIVTYSGIIAEEVANEKGTRIMEIILSSASATQHFFGKLVGVSIVMLTQIAIYIAAGTGAYFYFRNTDFVQGLIGGFDLVAMLQELLGYTLVFFIGGVLMYVILAAFFGSLATKMEDVNKAVTPIVFIALAGFYIGLFAFNSPENAVSVFFSYFPLFTPFVMPFRIASGTVATSGIWLSIIGTAAFTVLIAVVSLAFYRSNVLVYSDTNILGTIKRSWNIMQSNKKAKAMQSKN
ncbi:MAG: ABC transporter permease [Alkalibacterium sp.]|nr:ABC transporter permease [Alkalibacterium sp.]